MAAGLMGLRASVLEARFCALSCRGGGVLRRIERVREAWVRAGGGGEGAAWGGEEGGEEGRGGRERERERGGKLLARAEDAEEERWERRRWDSRTSTPGEERRKEAASWAQEL